MRSNEKEKKKMGEGKGKIEVEIPSPSLSYLLFSSYLALKGTEISLQKYSPTSSTPSFAIQIGWRWKQNRGKAPQPHFKGTLSSL